MRKEALLVLAKQKADADKSPKFDYGKYLE
jgi:hypothetical protein